MHKNASLLEAGLLVRGRDLVPHTHLHLSRAHLEAGDDVLMMVMMMMTMMVMMMRTTTTTTMLLGVMRLSVAIGHCGKADGNNDDGSDGGDADDHVKDDEGDEDAAFCIRPHAQPAHGGIRSLLQAAAAG